MKNRIVLGEQNEIITAEIAKNIKYMLEEKFQLEQEIRAGEDAKHKLKKLERDLKANMVMYAGIKDVR